MSTHYKHYFTTALRIGLFAFALESALANAQEKSLDSQDAPCEQALGLKTFHFYDHQLSNGWWFLPSDQSSSERFRASTLPFTTAQDRVFSFEGSPIFINVPAVGVDSLPKEYLIIRSKPIKKGMYQAALGDFVEVIGRAQLDMKTGDSISSLKEGKNTSEPATLEVALNISAASQEILPTDRLLPKVCADSSEINPRILNGSIQKNETTKVLTLLNHAFIGAEATIILVDKGRNQGVQVGQHWNLLDKLSKSSRSAKSFGEAKALQAFDNMSIFVVNTAKHEVQEGDLLQYTADTP